MKKISAGLLGAALLALPAAAFAGGYYDYGYGNGYPSYYDTSYYYPMQYGYGNFQPMMQEYLCNGEWSYSPCMYQYQQYQPTYYYNQPTYSMYNYPQYQYYYPQQYNPYMFNNNLNMNTNINNNVNMVSAYGYSYMPAYGYYW